MLDLSKGPVFGHRVRNRKREENRQTAPGPIDQVLALYRGVETIPLVWYLTRLFLKVLARKYLMDSPNIFKTFNSAVDNLSNIGIIFRNAENRTRGCWVRSKNATSVLRRLSKR